MSSTSLAGHTWWLASRASGIVALLLVTVSVGLGLAMAGKVARRPGLPKILMSIHEQTAVIGLVAIAVHGITLLGDPWLNPGPSGIAIPFTMAYKPLFTGLGIVGGYLAAILGLSFYLRRRIGPRLWRKAHRATVVVYVLGVIHTLGAGTDASTSWMRAFMFVTGIPIAVLFVIRVLEARFASRRQGSRAPAPVRTLRPVPHHQAQIARPPRAVGEEA